LFVLVVVVGNAVGIRIHHDLGIFPNKKGQVVVYFLQCEGVIGGVFEGGIIDDDINVAVIEMHPFRRVEI
jgi:hypothetical protein